MPIAVAASVFTLFLPMMAPVARGEAVRAAVAWAPALHVELSVVDGLSLTFALLISGIGVPIAL